MDVYHALVEVLEEFCRLVLSEPTIEFEAWRERVQVAVAPHGSLLTDLCPLLEKVIGPQPPVEPVDEALARLRFHQVVIRFLQAVCRPEHPVIIALDDLQWVSLDSALLWQSVISAPSLMNLLVVGAYREDEVGPDHPIHSLLRALESARVRVTEVILKNLESPLIQRVIATALGSDPAEVLDLTFLVFLKTKGNPYFSNEFLNSLYKDRLLSFHLGEQKWRWDTKGIVEYGAARSVVDLFVNKILKLDEDTQRTLQYAALIGRRFDSATLLAMVGHEKAGLLAFSLWRAIAEGLIYPLDENYRFLAGEKKVGTGSNRDETTDQSSRNPRGSDLF